MFQTKSVMMKYSGKATLEALAQHSGKGFKATVETAGKSIEARVSDWLRLLLNIELTNFSN